MFNKLSGKQLRAAVYFQTVALDNKCQLSFHDLSFPSAVYKRIQIRLKLRLNYLVVKIGKSCLLIFDDL